MGNKKTFDDRVKDSRKVHGTKYTYLSLYHEKDRPFLKIVCPEHGEFTQRADIHLNHGCSDCGNDKKRNKDGFFKEAKRKRGHDYTKSVYVNNHTEITITCPEGHDYEQTPPNHLNYQNGCKKCKKKENSLENEKKFLNNAKEIRPDHDCSKVIGKYINNSTLVTITCPEGHEYTVKPIHFLDIDKGGGCKECNGGVKSTLLDFIEKSKTLYGENKFDYRKSVYVNSTKPLILICKKHNEEFKITPNCHLYKVSQSMGGGCSICRGYSRNIVSVNNFIELIKPYNIESLTDYLEFYKKNPEFCTINGLPQRPDQYYEEYKTLINWSRAKVSKGEKKIIECLEEKNIKFYKQETIEGCKNEKLLPFDFYLPIYDLYIEYDGEQHFHPINFFGGEEGLKKRQRLDKIKTDFCKNNNIKLVRIPYTKFNNIETILKNHI